MNDFGCQMVPKLFRTSFCAWLGRALDVFVRSSVGCVGYMDGDPDGNKLGSSVGVDDGVTLGDNKGNPEGLVLCVSVGRSLRDEVGPPHRHFFSLCAF